MAAGAPSRGQLAPSGRSSPLLAAGGRSPRAALDDVDLACTPRLMERRHSGGTASSVGGASSVGPSVASVWEENATSCGICGDKIGKMTRHHCRVCGRCVCAPCSPSQLVLEGHRRPQRACTPCVAGIQTIGPVKERLTRLHSQLAALAGDHVPFADEPRSLEEAASLCEASLGPAEAALAAAVARGERTEAALAAATAQAQRAETEAETERGARVEAEAKAVSLLLSLGERLHALPPAPSWPATGRSRAAVAAPSPGGGLQEAAAYCEAALGPLAQAVERPWRRARSKSQDRRPSIARSVSDREEDEEAAGVGAAALAEEEAAGPATPRGRRSAPATPTQPRVVDESAWEEDATSCSVCSARIGKRFFKRRHHCRLCGRCVCSACSPGSVSVQGRHGPQRACKLCVAAAEPGAGAGGAAAAGQAKGPLRAWMHKFGDRLSAAQQPPRHANSGSEALQGSTRPGSSEHTSDEERQNPFEREMRGTARGAAWAAE